MTAVSTDNTKLMEAKLLTAGAFYADLPVAASTVIYRNTFVGLNATGYLTSYVAPAVYTGATSTGTSLRGIACEHVASQTSDGDKTCRVLIDGYFTYYLASVSVADVGCPVFATDNATLTADATAGGYVGQIVAYDRAGYCTIRLNPLAIWAGQFLTVCAPILDLPTVNQKILLVHATDNHNGLILCTCSAYVIEAHRGTSAQGTITIQHTADTSMGCTLAAADNCAALDSIVGAGGCLWAPASATDDAIVKAPAGVEVNAEVTTAAAENGSETGTAKVFATLMAL